ncbi:2-C-methyl-D-erythritol 2,4-cyclodiphosphate synthase [Schaalia sp. lx-100]|uniref:2-C-methyl-D-erythritol 2,4-cyclodiphosphate synthase n=1 Tax=Schaalia sp. lx-100 TaxID=2899081 RepID=UPI001E3E3EA1|nr:2-C-methyl-D-erythritol 2,4-cyclodiphosphate synthase [Schaalia sp. lx-100]MCD4557684.1 2-C-methyl-D-erythritol 2,4-cyclodiphosphate synthase [Schaalia sp. lx-100]
MSDSLSTVLSDMSPAEPFFPFRTGQACDVHAFAKDHASERPLMLACLQWPDETPLSGHSDADVAAHALCDAILTACGLGELGTVFGTDRPQWANASGETFMREVMRMAHDAGWRLGNATVQIIGKRPRMAARLPEACQRMSSIVSAPVSVSATTTDGLGFTGRGDGLAAIANVLVFRKDFLGANLSGFGGVSQ